MAIKSRRIGEQVDRNTLGRIRVLNSGIACKKGDILSVVGTNPSGGHLTVQIADADGAGALKTGAKLVAQHDIAAGKTGIAVSWIIVAYDTSGTGPLGALADGDILYLKDGQAAGDTLVAALPAGGKYQREVGQVLIGASTSGKLLLSVQFTAGTI
tara:strand:- start:1872 stop:2339 length:468 start_codon:yes stop_codon:yes gene_type:complete